MKEFAKPRIVISRCIEFEPVRYDGQMISNDFVKKLMNFVEFITVCPEVEIGLGIPRKRLRIVMINGERRLIQPETNLDFTEKMQLFSNKFLNSLQDIDGFILKSRSPSSGIRGAKIYPGIKNVASIGRSAGLFGGKVLEKFGHLAIEEDDRLRNLRIREHFLSKIYTFADFRNVKSTKSLPNLIRFHTENKLLLKAYNQKRLERLGRIVANEEKKSLDDILHHYENELWKSLKRPPRRGANINVISHAFGYFSKELSSEEKKYFLKSLEKYRSNKILLSTILGILKVLIIRFQEEYLLKQSFLQPYPEELIETDENESKEKDYWKF